MKQKTHIRLLIILALCAIFVFMLILFTLNRTERRFPMWESAESEVVVTGVDPVFERLEKKLPLHETDQFVDNIHIIIANHSDQMITYSYDGFKIDFFHKNEWYTVFKEEYFMMGEVSPEIIRPGEEYKTYFVVPSQALNQRGKYRLYVHGIGYSFFDIE